MRVGALIAVCGLVVLSGVLAALTFRTSLWVTLLAGVVMLSWRVVRPGQSLWRPTLAAYGVAVVVAALPVDMRVVNAGRLRVGWVPYVWGLPSAEQHRLAGAGEIVAPGCIVPEYPSRYALLFSW
jgi:hypothetical protein